MRYQVGKKYTFVSFLTENTKGCGGTVFFPPWMDRQISCSMLHLECIEHHKVSWEYDQADGKEHDGFVFQEADSRALWYNQYPRASYGQLDDSQNWIIRAANFKAEDTYWHYKDLSQYLANVLRGIHMLVGESSEAEALQQHYTSVVEQYTSATGLKVHHEPLVIAGRELPGFYSVTFKE